MFHDNHGCQLPITIRIIMTVSLMQLLSGTLPLAVIAESSKRLNTSKAAFAVLERRQHRPHQTDIQGGATVPFVLPHHQRSTLTAIYAKKVASKKTATRKRTTTTTDAGSGGGGFGAAASSSSVKKGSDTNQNMDDDYAIFPRLEQQVLDTLIPASDQDSTAPTSSSIAGGDLPPEIYQRLSQIYGFPHFNYQTVSDESQPPTTLQNEQTLFTDLLSSSSSPSSSPLDNLFATSLTAADQMTIVSSSSLLPDNDSPNDFSHSLDSLPPFSNFRVLHVDPLVLQIDQFFTDAECDRYIALSNSVGTGKEDQAAILSSRSPTVGKDAKSKAQRTSTTWYHYYKNVPELMAKACRLLGLDTLAQFEEPQTVRYRRNEKFTWHLDALGPLENQNQKGGQRIATLLVYLTELTDFDGGATMFRDLAPAGGGDTGDSSNHGPLKMRPQKGSALLFFPAAGGIPDTPLDIRTLHCGQAVSNDATQDKWISQLWLRAMPYAPSLPGNVQDGPKIQAAIEEYCQQFVKEVS